MTNEHASTANPVLEIIYVSRRTPSISRSQVVDEIVLPSMRRNRANNITGCLWFDDTHFVQLIEGEAARVEILFDRIAKDYRHRNVKVICKTNHLVRSFERNHIHAVSDASDQSIQDIVDHYTKHCPDDTDCDETPACTETPAPPPRDPLVKWFSNTLRKSPEC